MVVPRQTGEDSAVLVGDAKGFQLERFAAGRGALCPTQGASARLRRRWRRFRFLTGPGAQKRYGDDPGVPV
jgi:hypothetical protein